MKLKIGSKVRSKFQGNFGEEGVVTKLDLWDAKKESDLTASDHGTIEVRITKTTKKSYLTIGEFEHYSYFDWQSVLEII